MTPATRPTNPRPNVLRRRSLIPLISGAIAIGALIAGCGGSSSTASAPQSGVRQARTQFVGFAACMRSRGVPGYPDPRVSGTADGVSVTISPGSANPDSPAFRSADRACHHLLPNGGVQGGPGGGSAQQQAQDVVFADCMRSHGISGFPDPGHDGVFTLPATIDEQAPAFVRAMHACQKVQPSSLSIYQTN
jgi:hypothetical protein